MNLTNARFYWLGYGRYAFLLIVHCLTNSDPNTVACFQEYKLSFYVIARHTQGPYGELPQVKRKNSLLDSHLIYTNGGMQVIRD